MGHRFAARRRVLRVFIFTHRRGVRHSHQYRDAQQPDYGVAFEYRCTFLYAVLYTVLFTVAQGIDGAGWLFLRYFLPSALVSVLFTPIVYLLVRFVMRRTRV